MNKDYIIWLLMLALIAAGTKIGYLTGKQEVYTTFVKDDSGTCFATDGCAEPDTHKRH